MKRVTVLAAVAMYLLWYGEEYDSTKFWIAFSFLTIFWLMVFSLELARAINREHSYPIQRGVLTSGFFLFYFFGTYALFHERFPDWAAPAALVIGVIYYSVGVFVRGKGENKSIPIMESSISLGQSIGSTPINFVLRSFFEGFTAESGDR